MMAQRIAAMMKHILTTFTAIAMVSVGFSADEAKLELTGNDQMQFNKKELTVTTGQEVTLTFKHVGKLPKAAMGHNVVILKPGTAIAPFAMKAASQAANDYIPKEEELAAKIVAHTKMIGGGESTTVTFTAPEPGVYPYICSFPGHFGIMQGKLTVKAAE